MNGGPYAQTTGLDHIPLDIFGGRAGIGADVTDASADLNVAGSNSVAGNAAAEAKEIAAVPDPQSPAGQAAILAIIQRYQGKSAGTVESSTATEQANGAQAADSKSDGGKDRSDHHDDSDGLGRGSGGSLMDILSSLLGSGGSGMGGMSPFGQQGMSPFGQQGMSPFGDPYAQQAGATQAANPFADPFAGSSPAGTPATQAAAYNPSADPFAATPSTGTATVTNAGNSTTDPFAANGAGGQSGKPDNDGGSGGSGGSVGSTGAATSKGSSSGGVDASAFSGADGAAVPTDPAASTP